jgi:hypothetical protein
MSEAPEPVPDGRYDAIVVDAAPNEDGTTRVELTILDGPHKGEVVVVRARGLAGDELDLLGIPATLTVADGAPRVALEP